jgi:hypothetical protein
MKVTGLSMWVIYWNPRDFPNRYIVRRWLVDGAGPVADDEPSAIVETLDEARRSIPDGLFCLDRAEADEKQIVEIWL